MSAQGRCQGRGVLWKGVAVSFVVFAAPPAAADIRDLPVPAVTIYPNDIITTGSITQRRFRVTSTSIIGFATDSASIIGTQARRRLVAGRPIPLAAFGVPIAIRRGDNVSANYMEEGFSITASLMAMQDGMAGDVIEARNNGTGVLVRATVQADGTLRVTGE